MTSLANQRLLSRRRDRGPRVERLSTWRQPISWLLKLCNDSARQTDPPFPHEQVDLRSAVTTAVQRLWGSYRDASDGAVDHAFFRWKCSTVEMVLVTRTLDR